MQVSGAMLGGGLMLSIARARRCGEEATVMVAVVFQGGQRQAVYGVSAQKGAHVLMSTHE